MTRYDPFGYGEVHLDPERPEAEGPQEAEDLLFAGGDEVKHAPPADESWEMLQQEPLDELLPGGDLGSTAAFGQEILGEAPPIGADGIETMMAAPAAVETEHATAVASGATAQTAQAVARPASGHRDVVRRPLVRPQPQATVSSSPRHQPDAMPRRMPVAGMVVAFALCAGGGTAASWFWLMQQNAVMAGIVGAATLVSALFAWLFLRG